MQARLLWLLVLAFLPIFALDASAAYIVTISQVGANVTASGSGSLNLSSGFLAFSSNNFQPPLVQPAYNVLYLGASGGLDADEYVFGSVVPGNFGSGNGRDFDTGSGPFVGLDGSSILIVPHGYVSGTPLGTSSDTFLNATLATLGITPGSYVFQFGNGATADSFTIQVNSVSTGAVAEPESVGLLGIGFVGLMAMWRRRKS